MKAIERARRRWNGASAEPTRIPDFEMHGWMEKGHVDWVRLLWYPGPVEAFKHHERVAMLIDAAWVHADGAPELEQKEKPGIWMTLDQDGRLTWITSRELTRGTGVAQAWWLLKYWARVSLKWWRLAWRSAKGQG